MRYRLRTLLPGQFGLLTLFGAMTVAAIACGIMHLPLEQSDKMALLGTIGSVSILFLAMILEKRQEPRPMFRYSLRSRLFIAAGFILVLFGYRCLNYTKASGWEHHTAVAERYGLPRPSERILFAGAVSLVAGAGLVGYAIGSRRTAS